MLQPIVYANIVLIGYVKLMNHAVYLLISAIFWKKVDRSATIFASRNIKRPCIFQRIKGKFNFYPAKILCPEDVVCFLRMLHIFKCTSEVQTRFYHGSKHFEP